MDGITQVLLDVPEEKLAKLLVSESFMINVGLMYHW